jgi:hypothetical protein
VCDLGFFFDEFLGMRNILRAFAEIDTFEIWEKTGLNSLSVIRLLLFSDIMLSCLEFNMCPIFS